MRGAAVGGAAFTLTLSDSQGILSYFEGEMVAGLYEGINSCHQKLIDEQFKERAERAKRGMRFLR